MISAHRELNLDREPVRHLRVKWRNSGKSACEKYTVAFGEWTVGIFAILGRVDMPKCYQNMPQGVLKHTVTLHFLCFEKKSRQGLLCISPERPEVSNFEGDLF